MTLLYSIAHFNKGFDMSLNYFFYALIGVLLYVLLMLGINFFAKKNELTNKGSFTVFLFAFITAVLPNSLVNFPILLSNVFVLLAIQNVLHLRNERQIKAKIFNASMCVAIASLAYFWSISFIIMVYIGVLYFTPKDYRNWLIPILGLGVVFLFATCFTLYVKDTFFSFSEYIDPVSFSFKSYLVKDQLFSVGILCICLFFFLSVYLITFRRKAANTKPLLRIILAYLMVTIIVAVIAPFKNTSELFFITIPLALIGTTYFELKFSSLAKEINMWVCVLIPFTLVLL